LSGVLSVRTTRVEDSQPSSPRSANGGSWYSCCHRPASQMQLSCVAVLVPLQSLRSVVGPEPADSYSEEPLRKQCSEEFRVEGCCSWGLSFVGGPPRGTVCSGTQGMFEPRAASQANRLSRLCNPKHYHSYAVGAVLEPRELCRSTRRRSRHSAFSLSRRLSRGMSPSRARPHRRDRRHPGRRHQPGSLDGLLPHRRAPRERDDVQLQRRLAVFRGRSDPLAPSLLTSDAAPLQRCGAVRAPEGSDE
jgi:hypothetical protein